MESKKFVTGQILQMQDHAEAGKTGRLSKHYYLILGKGNNKQMSMYQTMCITSMEHCNVTWELPIMNEGFVCYVECDNIHTFTENELMRGSLKEQLDSNRFMTVEQFVMLAHDVHMIRTFNFLSGNIYTSIIKRFHEYCTTFARIHEKDRELKYCKRGINTTADHYYKYNPPKEVLDVISVNDTVYEKPVNIPQAELETVASTVEVPCEFPFEDETMEVPVEEEKKPVVKRTRKPAARTMENDDMILLQILERDAEKRVSKWNDTNIDRFMRLYKKYKGVTLAANSKRWSTGTSWTNTAKAISKYHGVDSDTYEIESVDETENETSTSSENASVPEGFKTRSSMSMTDLVALSECIDGEMGDIPSWTTEHLKSFKEITEKYTAKVISENNLMFTSVMAVNKAKDRVVAQLKTRPAENKVVPISVERESSTINYDWKEPISKWSKKKIEYFLNETDRNYMGKKRLEKFTGLPFGEARKLISDVRALQWAKTAK